jgi:hypothetical protein
MTARTEIGKWLNEQPNREIDRQALAELCADYDRLIAVARMADELMATLYADDDIAALQYKTRILLGALLDLELKIIDEEMAVDEGESELNVGLERNCRVQDRFDTMAREGKHGFYETLFAVVREEVEREREACAKVCEARPAFSQLAHDCAEAIRMRS